MGAMASLFSAVRCTGFGSRTAELWFRLAVHFWKCFILNHWNKKSCNKSTQQRIGTLRAISPIGYRRKETQEPVTRVLGFPWLRPQNSTSAVFYAKGPSETKQADMNNFSSIFSNVSALLVSKT
jgi:hypothetical protein